MALFSNLNLNKYLVINQCYDRLFNSGHIQPEYHIHNGIELMYIVNGKVSVKFNLYNEISNINLYTGDFILLNSEQYHRLYVSQDARIINIEISESNEPLYPLQRKIERILDYSPNLKNFWNLNPDNIRIYDNINIIGTISKIVGYFTNEEKQPMSIIDLMLNILLIEISNQYMKNLKSYKGYSYVRQAVFIIEDLMGIITPDILAEQLGISKIYLHKLFMNCFDKSVLNYINQYRILRACDIIKQLPNKKISYLVTETGFNNLLSFERAFKKYVGVTPTEYKKNISKSKNILVSTYT